MTLRAGCLLGFALLLGCGAPPPLPHIVLITSDTLRADHLSLHGYPRNTSPAIDEFAGGAWDFTDAVTVIPKTGPSFATMFTGLHPEQHGVRSNFEGIPPDVLTLAQALKLVGYRTAAFVGNPVLRDTKGYGRGFDIYEHFNDLRADTVRQVTDRFLAWAVPEWTEPTFVWIHFMDPHGPYTPPDELAEPFLQDRWFDPLERIPAEGNPEFTVDSNKLLGALPRYQRRGDEDRLAAYIAHYDAEIRYVDSAFAEIVTFLRETGRFEQSAVVFGSDHGESLGEHDLYLEHGWFAYEATIHVPLIVKLPNQREGGVVARQVSNLDLLPTLMSVADVLPEPGSAGRDLFADPGRPQALVIENSDRYPFKIHGVRTAEFKFLRRDDGLEELYDLRADPGETRNLIDESPESAASLRQSLERSLVDLRGSKAATPSVGLPDDPETLERLRSLGYAE